MGRRSTARILLTAFPDPGNPFVFPAPDGYHGAFGAFALLRVEGRGRIAERSSA
jgi:hypothetical protein